MPSSTPFKSITTADFIVRAAYQTGKTPLLPLYAASLGAGDVLLGVIVSISTLTGMVLKPFIGILSDRSGRRIWLLVGTAVFAGMPFVYWLVRTPEQLVGVRIIHGMATAIYGPVTLAYVAELSEKNRAERLGWFSTARNTGYIVGPVAGGVMLLAMDPVVVFTVIGLVSSLAFIPVLRLPESVHRPNQRPSLLRESIRALWSGSRTPSIWLAAGLNASVLMAEYAIRTFLPLHALTIGANIAAAGVFFALQEAVHIILNPIGGRLGDRFGYMPVVGVGMGLMGVALSTLTLAFSPYMLFFPAVFIGTAQALVFPSTTALVSTQVNRRHLGLGMGLVGTLKNTAKIVGPIVAGAMIYWTGIQWTFQVIGLALVTAAVAVLLVHQFYGRSHRRTRGEKSRPIPAIDPR